MKWLSLRNCFHVERKAFLSGEKDRRKGETKKNTKEDKSEHKSEHTSPNNIRQGYTDLYHLILTILSSEANQKIERSNTAAT